MTLHQSVYVCWLTDLTVQCLYVNYASKSNLHTGPQIPSGHQQAHPCSRSAHMFDDKMDNRWDEDHK